MWGRGYTLYSFSCIGHFLLQGIGHLPLPGRFPGWRQSLPTLFRCARVYPRRLWWFWLGLRGRFGLLLLRFVLVFCGHELPPDKDDDPGGDLAGKGNVGELVDREQSLHALLVGDEVGLQMLGELLVHGPQRR